METPLTALVGGYFLCLKAVTTRDARPMSTSVYVNISAYVTTSRTPFLIAGVSAETPGGTAARAARDLPRAARAAQCRREPVFSGD